MALIEIPRSLRWPSWRHLPRDARDTLFLLGVIAWTVLPHVSHLPGWCIALTAVVLFWRAELALTNGALPSRWLLVGVLIVAGALTLWSYRTLLGKEPGITMAVVLMALKTLELRARRDAFVVFFLGFFLILTHFLYSQSLTVAAAMLVSVWGLLTALVLAHMPVGQPSLRQAAALSARTALLGAPIMALLFVLFPRVGPLWGVPQDGISRTGLSNTMKLGSVAEVAQDDAVAMRIRFEGRPPPPEAMYFRGPVLSRYDGREWRAAPGRGVILAPQMQVDGAPIRYEVTLEPLRLSTLPLLELTTSGPEIEGMRIAQRDDLAWTADRAVLERVRFSAEAHVRYQSGPLRMTPAVRADLDLPPDASPRTRAWAAALRAEPQLANAAPGVLAQAVLQRIRTGGYTYTLAPPDTTGTDPIDAFWLDTREGFCEHFAASFVVVMRAMGVPARVVTGYQGVEPVPVDGYYIVRQSSAHAWAEYWQSGTGWVRADPTAAVAPDRIVRSIRLAPAPGLVAGALEGVDPELLAALRNRWEAVNNRWNQWVLNYSRGQQLDLLKNFGYSSPSWEDLSLLLIGALSTLALAGAAWAWWDRRRIDPWVRQMERLRHGLQSVGISAAAHEAPAALAARVRQRHGAAGETIAGLLETLARQRYGREAAVRPDPGLTRRFGAAVRHLKHLPPAPAGAAEQPGMARG
jgi:transglutaminase-like putative cysteine protease